MQQIHDESDVNQLAKKAQESLTAYYQTLPTVPNKDKVCYLEHEIKCTWGYFVFCYLDLCIILYISCVVTGKRSYFFLLIK